MPELPEVETIVRLLRPKVVGRTVTGVHVEWMRTLGGVSKRRFRAGVVGAEVLAIRRRAKYLLFDLHRGGRARVLVGHLRMSGRFHVVPQHADPEPWSRVRLDLSDGYALVFVDVRKFGRLVLAKDEGQVLPPLGPEPLGADFTEEWFRQALGQRRRMLKPLLLDQSFLAGLGNIYVDEALFQSRLHPRRRSDRVPAARVAVLHAAIRATLADAIEREGSSFDGFYRTPEGQPGRYQHQFLVYGRAGDPCRRCGRKITKLVVGQRGTHVCTRCQPVPR